MGASTQKPFPAILAGKYSFVNPNSNRPLHLSCWRFSEEELECKAEIEGESLTWPFKLYSDEGYLFAYIVNSAVPLPPPPLQGKASAPAWQQLGSLRVSVGLIEFLYSFARREVEEYLEVEV